MYKIGEFCMFCSLLLYSRVLEYQLPIKYFDQTESYWTEIEPTIGFVQVNQLIIVHLLIFSGSKSEDILARPTVSRPTIDALSIDARNWYDNK